MSDSISNGVCCSGSVRPGTYGDAIDVAQITVDKCGRITKISNVAISVGGGGPIQTGISINYTALVTDYYIGVNGMNVTITLPPGTSVVNGKTYVIKDESGFISTNGLYKVTVIRSGSDLIDDHTSFIIALNYGAVNVIWTGSQWRIF